MKRKLIVPSHYIDGVLTEDREAIPIEIAAAHLKCKTCRYKKPKLEWTVCTRCASHAFGRPIKVTLDYCRHHSELTTPHTPQEETR